MDQPFLPPILPRGQFKPSEVAQVIVNNIAYSDWETVWAQERWNESFSFFRFTTAELDPNKPFFLDFQVAPCDQCLITLGGEDAIKGVVTQRQVAYDANRHQVMIIGKSDTWAPFKSHIRTELANMDGLNVKQIADKLLGKYNMKVDIVGTIDMRPFEKEQAPPGGNIWEYLEKLVRQRAALLGSNAAGHVLLIGDHTMGDLGALGGWSSTFGPDYVDGLIEGVNIKKMQATISIEDQWGEIQVLGQTSGGDDQNGSDANEMQGNASGRSCLQCDLVIPVEEPVKSQSELDQRAYFEAKWTDGTKITALITVQGWFNQAGLWHAGQNVKVYSPMATITQVLKVKTCTWTQDNESGTETVLECVNPWALNDDSGVNVGNPTAMPPPDKPASVQQLDIQQMQANAPKNLPVTPIPPP